MRYSLGQVSFGGVFRCVVEAMGSVKDTDIRLKGALWDSPMNTVSLNEQAEDMDTHNRMSTGQERVFNTPL
jgi:hypothetical protein